MYGEVRIIPVNFPPIMSIGSISFRMEGFPSGEPGMGMGIGEGIGTGEGLGIGISAIPSMVLTTTGSRKSDTRLAYSRISEKILAANILEKTCRRE